MADDEEDDEGDHEYRGTNAPQSAIDRSWALEEFRQKPWLLPHVLAVSLGENKDPRANLAVLESLCNRAAMMGTSIEQESRLSRHGGYYAGYDPASLSHPRYQRMLQDNLWACLGGSDVSNGATDNSSGSFADRRNSNGMFQRTIPITGGETFSRPLGRGARGADRYDMWRADNIGNGMAKGQLLDRDTYARIYEDVRQANPGASPAVIAQTVQYISSTMPKQKAIGPFDANKEERAQAKEHRAQETFNEKHLNRETKKFELAEKRARAERTDAKAQLNHLQQQRESILSKMGSAVDNDIKAKLQADLKIVSGELDQARQDFKTADTAYKRATVYHDDYVQHGVVHSDESLLADLKESAGKAASPEELAAVQKYADKYGIDFNAQRYKMEQPISPADEEAARSPGMGAPISTPNKVPDRAPSTSAFTDKEVSAMQAQAPRLPGAAPAQTNFETLKEWRNNLSNIWQNTKKDAGDIAEHPEQIAATFRHANGGTSVAEDAAKHREEDWSTMNTNPFEGRDPSTIGFLDNLMAHLNMFGAVSDMATGGLLNTYGGRVNEQVAKTTGSKTAGDVGELAAQLAIPMPAFGKAGKAAKVAEAAPERLALPKPPVYAGAGPGWSAAPKKEPLALPAPPTGRGYEPPRAPEQMSFDTTPAPIAHLGREFLQRQNSQPGTQLNLNFNAPQPRSPQGPLALPKPSTIYQPPSPHQLPPQKLLPPPEQGPQFRPSMPQAGAGQASTFPRQAPPSAPGGPITPPAPPNPYVNEPWAQGGIPAGYAGKGGVGNWDKIYSNPNASGGGATVSGQPGILDRIMNLFRSPEGETMRGANTMPKPPSAMPPSPPPTMAPTPAAPAPASPPPVMPSAPAPMPAASAPPTSRFKIPSLEQQKALLDDKVAEAAEKRKKKRTVKRKKPSADA